MLQNQENFYWLFSSSAQTISAFIAFLITGYALVLNVMQNLEQKDETYADIHHKLKERYYRRLIMLAIITGLAIIFSLWMVYLNGEICESKWWLYILTVTFNLAAIIMGLLFVLAIINPNKYKIAAKEIIREITKDDISISDNQKAINVDQVFFMREFINLERNLRNKLMNKSIYISLPEGPKSNLTFRDMVFGLFQNELITFDERQELLELNRYRNLVFHGHLEKVDSNMVARVAKANQIIGRIE